MNLDLYQLRTFFAVARALNFTEASKKLYLTQSAVSHSIKKLEGTAGGELLRRSGGKLELTETGRILYKACESVFYELDRAEELLAESEGRRLGTIRLGATVEFGTTLLVKYLKGFLAANPGVHVDFHFSNDLLKPLLNDGIDMAIDCKVHRAEGLQRVPLFREEYAVIASGAFIRRHRVASPRDLERCAVLSLDKGCSWWGNFLNVLPQAERPEFRDVTEMDHVRAIVNAAIESIGVGFVPKYCVLKELHAGTLVDVFPQLELLEDNFYVYQKAGKAGLERQRELLNYLKNLRATQLERA